MPSGPASWSGSDPDRPGSMRAVSRHPLPPGGRNRPRSRASEPTPGSGSPDGARRSAARSGSGLGRGPPPWHRDRRDGPARLRRAADRCRRGRGAPADRRRRAPFAAAPGGRPGAPAGPGAGAVRSQAPFRAAALDRLRRSALGGGRRSVRDAGRSAQRQRGFLRDGETKNSSRSCSGGSRRCASGSGRRCRIGGAWSRAAAPAVRARSGSGSCLIGDAADTSAPYRPGAFPGVAASRS